MKKLKKIVKRFALILLIVIAALIPVPITFNKKEGKFNDDHIIELVEKKEDDTATKTVKLEEKK